MAEETISTMTAVAETSPETSAPVDVTPPSETQAPDTQPRTEPTPETPTLSARERLAALLKSDVEIEREYQAKVNSDAQRIAAKQAKRERLTRAVEDPVAALEYAQAEHQEITAEDAKTQKVAETNRQVSQDLDDLFKSKTWAADYEALRTGPRAAEFNKEWAENRAGFADWADKQVTKAAIRREAEPMAKEMAKAMALDMTNEGLRNVPQMPTGNVGGTSDAALIASVPNMSGQEYLANKERIYAAIRRRDG